MGVGMGFLGMDTGLAVGFLLIGNLVLIPLGIVTLDATFILLAMCWSSSESLSIISLLLGGV